MRRLDRGSVIISVSLALWVLWPAARAQETTATISSGTTTILPPASNAVGAPALDHYTLYDAEGPDGPPRVTLEDRFQTEVLNLNPVVFFMSPTDANGGGISDPLTHLTCYGISTSMFGISLDVETPFGPQALRIGRPVALCVPTETDASPEPMSPLRDHYKCYEASGPPLEGVVMRLSDRFQDRSEVRVSDPLLLCNPVDKNAEGIVNSEKHLTCYATEPSGDSVGLLSIRNQFHEDEDLVFVFPPSALCVPSQKRDCAVDGDCDDGNACTGDSCDATNGCVHMPETGSCETGDPCTPVGQCADGACLALVQDVKNIACSLDELRSVSCDGKALPRKLKKLIAKKVRRARRFMQKAAEAAAKGNETKVEKFRTRATDQLEAIPKKTAKAAQARKTSRQISKACRAKIDGLVGEHQQMMGGFSF